MKRKIRKLAMLCLLLVGLIFCLTGCRKPYDTPEFVTIEASQTAFLIPLTGDTTEQASFESEEMLEQAKVATKEIQIPHRWVQTGRKNWQGDWRPSAKLIVVERKPVSRSWESGDSAATSQNAIWGETSDGIGFYVGMSCSAQINEEDATKFLYRFNNTPLETIIDNEIKTMVKDEFNRQASKYSSTELHSNKTNIITDVKDTVTEYFKEFGITITVLGTNEGFSFENQTIQSAIDKKFASEQELVTQQNMNEVTIAKAQAEAEAAKIAAQAKSEVVLIEAEAEAESNRKLAQSLTAEIIEKMRADNEKVMYEKWNGELPQIQGDSTPIISFKQ